MNQELRIKNKKIQGTKKRFTFYVPRFMSRGFTIIEMIIAVAIFSIVIVFSVGALLSIVNANKQAQSMKSIVNNLNYALETMVRSIRTGSSYDCDLVTLGLQDCPSTPSQNIRFIDQRGNVVSYILDNNKIGRFFGDTMKDVLYITADEVLIDRLKFYVNNASQPKVTILIGGKMILKGGRETRFDIETMAVQRFFNK